MTALAAPVRTRPVTVAALIVTSLVSWGCTSGCSVGFGVESDDDSVARQLTPISTPPVREGLAAAILIDVSGSMTESVRGEGGRSEKKIDIARRAAYGLVEQFERYAADHPAEPVLLGIYEFSRRADRPDLRPLLPMDVPSSPGAVAALAKAVADGGTPIGSAMIAAKHALDATGLGRRHLLVVTDGDNTDGVPPDRVAAAMSRRPEAERPSMYFVAFDIDASHFAGVRDAGGLLLAAGNAKELTSTLDGLLRGKILVEQ
ncbi:MAG: VWA domain-containing protein [Acidobacteria bacterium]|nr:VWA domain-containing protein [Acidobacteriota bacterium]